MPTRVALVGFGRVGRDLFRILYRNDEIQVAAISDVADPAALEYLLRYNTLSGPFPDEVSIREGHLYTVGQQIPMLDGNDPASHRWNDLGVDVVIEAAPRPLGRKELEAHLERGARRVILCVPPTEPPDLTVVMGVNDDALERKHRIVSNASCTAHAVAPVIKILHRAFGIRRAFLNTVHAFTNQQRLADVPMADKRRGRAAAENIIPQATQTAQVVGELLPELADRLSGMAMNVPVPNGSVVDLVCWHEKPVSVVAINEVIRTAAASADWQDVLCYEEDPIVSSDILGSAHSGLFDAEATMALGDEVSKTLTWFNSSWGYTHRVVDLIRRFEALDREEAA